MDEMLLLMILIPSPHRLLSTCNMPCMKNVSQRNFFFFFLQFKTIGHTLTNSFIHNYWTFSDILLYSKVLGNLQLFMRPFRTLSLDRDQYQHQTQCRFSHTLTPISCDVLAHKCNAICHCLSPCYIYMSAICTCLLIHFNPCINWKVISMNT